MWFWMLCFERDLNTSQILLAFVFLNCVMEPKAKFALYGLSAKPMLLLGGKPTGSSLSLGIFGQAVP